MMNDLPDVALSINQPWSWLIVRRYKPIENRNWRTNYRGAIAIHAGKKLDTAAWNDVVSGFHPVTGALQRFDFDEAAARSGGIVGLADIVDCVEESDSDWFVGRYGFVLANQRAVDFIPCKGALGLFNWKERVTT